MSDQDLLQMFHAMLNIRTTKIEPARILGPSLVGKTTFRHVVEDEVAAMEFARSLGIRTPAVRRVIIPPEEELSFPLIVMDRVHGSTLEELWPKLGWWRTARLAWQLRLWIQAMQNAHSQVGGGLATGIFYSQWLQDCSGPKDGASPEEFTSFLNWCIRPPKSLGLIKRTKTALLQPLKTHSFVHQDLVPRNMIIDDDNNLWVVDWGSAGWYPSYCVHGVYGDARSTLTRSSATFVVAYNLLVEMGLFPISGYRIHWDILQEVLSSTDGSEENRSQ